MKQYLVVKMMEGLNRASELMALPGFYSLEAAQELVMKALSAEPQSKYVIQEVVRHNLRTTQDAMGLYAEFPGGLVWLNLHPGYA